MHYLLHYIFHMHFIGFLALCDRSKQESYYRLILQGCVCWLLHHKKTIIHFIFRLLLKKQFKNEFHCDISCKLFIFYGKDYE